MNKQSIETAIAKLLNKSKTQDEIIEIYNVAKTLCSGKLISMQQDAEEKANQLQNTIDRINGN